MAIPRDTARRQPGHSGWLLFHGHSKASPVLAPLAIQQFQHTESDSGPPPLPGKFSEQHGHDRKNSADPGCPQQSLISPSLPCYHRPLQFPEVTRPLINCQNCIFLQLFDEIVKYNNVSTASVLTSSVSCHY